MLRIGLTGGIGSGKTTVARVFELLGIPVFYADTVAKDIMNEDDDLKTQIIAYFGESSYINGTLNRAFISSAVFQNEEKLNFLNSLIHPATLKAAGKWMKKQTGPYVLKEAALIFESGSQESLDYVIGVYAPQSLRLQRTMQRDKATREAVLQRMRNQINEEMKMKLCDFIIYNDEQQLVIPQVIALHEKLSGIQQPD